MFSMNTHAAPPVLEGRGSAPPTPHGGDPGRPASAGLPSPTALEGGRDLGPLFARPVQRQGEGPRSLLSVRQRPCGEPVWRLDTGVVGVGEAAWCPDRARARVERRSHRVSASELETQLERARRLKLPPWVVFAPHEDAFAASADPARRDEILSMMRRLIDAGIGLVVTTRGDVRDAEGLLALARRRPDALSVRIGLFSTESTLEAKWERGLAPGIRRLALGRSLKELGVRVEVELGPIVPFANDDGRQLKEAVRLVARSGLDAIAPRWIEDAPGLERQLEQEVSPSTARLVTGWFRQPGSNAGQAYRRILPLQVRRSRLEQLHDAASHARIRLVTCACSEQGACVACLEGRDLSAPQLDLFERLA